MKNILSIYPIDKPLYIDSVKKYNYMAHMLLPNNVNIFQTNIAREQVYLNPLQFVIAIYPVYKLLWKHSHLIIEANYITLSSSIQNIITFNIVLDTIMSNKENIKFLKDYIIIQDGSNTRISYEAYAYVTILSEVPLKLSSISNHQVYGIVESANKLGILCDNVKRSNVINPMFTFSKSKLRSINVDAQLKIFDIFILRNNCMVSGGTGIGKTTIIPKIFWWFNTLFNGFDFFNKVLDMNIENFIFNTTFTEKKTILSLPRKALIRQMGINYYTTLGFKEINKSPIVLKYKDVKNELEYYNKYPLPINQFVVCVNRLTVMNISQANTLIIDEIHEHDKFGDISIAVAKKLKLSYNLRNIVLISATIESDYDTIVDFFHSIDEINIPGKSLFPVTELECFDPIIEILKKNMPSKGKSVIIFVETIKKIIDLKIEIDLTFKNSIYKTYAIHSKVIDMNTILNKLQIDTKHIHIIISTNILESSITITNAVLVIDNGKMYQKIFLDGTIMYITDSMYRQRRGRVGRIAPGKYIRTYSIKKLQLAFKHINYQYLWDYIIIFKYFNLDFYRDLFIKPDNPNRIDKTIQYMQSKDINIYTNINMIFSKYNTYEINMIDHLYIYLHGTKDEIQMFNTFIKNISNDKYILDANLKPILKNLNVICKCIMVKKYERISIATLKLLHPYDGYPLFKVFSEANNKTIKLNKKYYMISAEPIKVIA